MNRYLLMVGFMMFFFSNLLQAETPTHEQFLMACNELKVGEACWAVGYSYENGKDFHGNSIGQRPIDSVKFYKVGCELGEPRACFNLGNNLLSGYYADVSGIPEKAGDGVTYLEKGCELKHSKSCFNYAYMMRRFANGKGKALWGFRRACELGLKEACQEIEKLN